MLFNLDAFLADLKENPEKKKVYEDYDKYIEPLSQIKSTKDMKWYKEYSSEFRTINYLVPDELKNDFDWKLLCQLVGSSFSSDGLFEFTSKNAEAEFIIAVQSGGQTVVKKMSELWGFQILRLYEIYVEELMNLEVLMATDVKEKEAIVPHRKARKDRWNSIMEGVELERVLGKYGL